MFVSKVGEPTQERGGRRKLIFTITSYGRTTLNEMKEVRARLWNLLPPTLKREGI